MTVGRRMALSATALLSLSLMSCGSASTSTAPSEATASGAATQPTATTSPDATVPAATAPTSGASSTSTLSTVDDRPIDTEAQALAMAAALHPENFPAQWAVYAPGEPFRATPQNCSYRPDGAATQVSNGGAQAGPTMQLADTGAFAESSALAFPDESLASEYIGVVNTDAWGVCRTGQLQQVLVDNGSDNLVTLATRDDPTLNQQGFESYAQFNISAPDGTVNAGVLISFYRIGRTVIMTTLHIPELSDAEFKTFMDDAYTALSASYDRVNAL